MAKNIAEIKTSATVWDKYVEYKTKTIDDSKYLFPIDDFEQIELELEDETFRHQMVFTYF